MVQLCVLGPLHVTRRGEPIPVTGALLRRLLLRLAVQVPNPVSQSELVDALWPAAHPAGRPTDSANALQSLVSRLRRVLGDGGLVQQVPGGYRLAVARSAIDAHRAGDLAAQGRRQLSEGDAAAALDTLAEARDLFRGQPLFDAGDDAGYAGQLAPRLGDLRLDILSDLFEAHLRLGRSDEVLSELEQLAAGDLLRERLTGQLMSALAASGRTAEALAAYERLRAHLADELGVDPSAELQARHLALLRGELPAMPAMPAAPAAAEPSGRAAAKTNVRAFYTSFVGREQELDRVGRLLTEHRLTTIVGPGGAGKTRLAAQAASSWPGRLRDGVWMVELAPISESDGLSSICSAILDALGSRTIKTLERMPERQRHDSFDRLFDLLDRADCLLILDNCEHLLGPVADLVDRILARCPEVRVLTTSREPLGIVGEALCAIPPLGVPPQGSDVAQARLYPAVQLLIDRAAASTEFAITDDTVGPVVEIVRRLDGLPLAIELAAARLRVLPIAQIAARLSDRFRLLSGGTRAAVPRHRTLRAVVEWSWDLLSPAERLLAERLAVFPAGATPDSAAAVCGDDQVRAQDVPDLLMSLADKSLLELTGQQELRYRMLETIREYGIERLTERGEVDAARAAHARYFAARAQLVEPVLRTSEQLGALRELAVERENILSALRYLVDSGSGNRAIDLTLALGWYWTLIGAHSDALTWIEFTLQATSGAQQGWDHPDRIYLEAVQAIASIFGQTDGNATGGDVNAWVRWRATLQEVSRRLEARPVDRSRQLDLVLRPMLAYFSGDAERAEFLAEVALASPDPWVRAATMVMRAGFAENEGDVEKMRKSVDVAQREFSLIGDRWGLATVLGHRAVLRTLEGDLAGAIEDLEMALQYTAEVGAFEDDLILHLRLADLKMRVGDMSAARKHLALATDVNSARPATSERQILTEAALASLSQLEGDNETALRMIGQLRERVSRQDAGHLIRGHLAALVGSVAAVIAVENGRLDEARADLAQAYPEGVATQDLPVLAGVGVAVAMFARAVSRGEDAALVLGASASLRGGEDATELRIARLTGALRQELGEQFEQLYQRGRGMERAEAISRLDPAGL